VKPLVTNQGRRMLALATMHGFDAVPARPAGHRFVPNFP